MSDHGEKPYQDEDWLRHQYVELGKTFTEIGEEVGRTQSLIARYARDMDFEVRGKGEAPKSVRNGLHNDPEWLREQYEDRKRSTTEIADAQDVDTQTIRNRLIEFNIPLRDKSEANKIRHRKHHPKINTGIFSGYEIVKWNNDQVRVHQLIVIAHGADPYKVFSSGEYHVHHGCEEGRLPEAEIPWANWPTNLELLSNSEHSSKHINERVRQPDGELKPVSES